LASIGVVSEPATSQRSSIQSDPHTARQRKSRRHEDPKIAKQKNEKQLMQGLGVSVKLLLAEEGYSKRDIDRIARCDGGRIPDTVLKSLHGIRRGASVARKEKKLPMPQRKAILRLCFQKADAHRPG